MIIKQNSLTKKALYGLAIFSLLAIIVSCGCVNPTSPKRLTDPDMQSNSHVVDFPENTITINAPVDLNIMNFVRPGSNLTIDDVSITFSPGVDMFIADTNYLNINLANGTIVGDIKLNQRLDCENPIDDNVDNNYEIATFNIVTPDDSINDEFKIIVRITDVEVEVTKVEILIDKFHLPAGNALRGIKELYLYEDLSASDPNGTGDDNKNFLSANLIASTSVIGEMYPGSDITKLYDKDDVNDGFLIDTANTNMSNIYHRLTFDFKEKVNLKKVAIRSRQMDGYEGFYFIIRDENNHILHVQRANASSARRSADADATSIYSYVPSYGLSRYPISDFDIKKYNNNDFTLYENTTNVILIDNFYVKQGYEYERGFVKFSRPGADIDKFNTNNVFFVYNQLMGLSFKEAPDFEMADDANGDNTYEVGTVTITNVDGGRIDFPMSVRTLDVHSTVLLKTNAVGQNAVSLTIDVYTSNIIENLLEFVDFVGLGIDPATVGDIAYNYRLIGDDAIHFKTVRNTLKTKSSFGFISNGTAINPEYNLQVEYIPDDGISEFLDITVRVSPFTTTNKVSNTVSIYTSNIVENLLDFYDADALGIEPSFLNMDYRLSGADAIYFRIENDTLKTVAGYGFSNAFDNDGEYNLQVHYNPAIEEGVRHQMLEVKIILSLEWTEIISSTPYSIRTEFQAVVLNNNDILVIGGQIGSGTIPDLSSKESVYLSSDGGTNWSNVTPTANHWINKNSHQAVVLNNDDILVMGGNVFIRKFRHLFTITNEFTTIYEYPVILNLSVNDIWSSDNGGRSWRQTVESAPWNGRSDFQTVVLRNGNVLVMGGYSKNFYTGDEMSGAGDVSTDSGHLTNGRVNSDIYLSRNGGVNWENITPGAGGHWSDRKDFQAVVLNNNNDILVMGGRGDYSRLNDVWLSSDGGRNWSQIPASNHWSPRDSFQAVVLPNNDILVMGGLEGLYKKNDVWLSRDGGMNWNEVNFGRRWTSRFAFQAVVMNGNVLILGGFNGYSKNDVWMLKLDDMYNKYY